jgi:hypothetical protein
MWPALVLSLALSLASGAEPTSPGTSRSSVTALALHTWNLPPSTFGLDLAGSGFSAYPLPDLINQLSMQDGGDGDGDNDDWEGEFIDIPGQPPLGSFLDCGGSAQFIADGIATGTGSTPQRAIQSAIDNFESHVLYQCLDCPPPLGIPCKSQVGPQGGAFNVISNLPNALPDGGIQFTAKLKFFGVWLFVCSNPCPKPIA